MTTEPDLLDVLDAYDVPWVTTPPPAPKDSNQGCGYWEALIEHENEAA